jgi:hypothetical protein
MEKILCFDNFIKEEEMEICKTFIYKPNWLFGNLSNKNDKINIPFWHLNLDENEFFSVYLKSKIEFATGKKFALKQVYANGQTFGQDGTFHTDHKLDNHWTFCLYIYENNYTPIGMNIDSIGGDIQFKLPELKPFLISIEPLNNRGILFPSTYIHRGLSFNRFVNDIRICIAWKLEEII